MKIAAARQIPDDGVGLRQRAPSSNSTTGTWPALLSLRNGAVRVSRLSVSTAIQL